MNPTHPRMDREQEMREETNMQRELATVARWWADQMPRPKATLAEQVGAQPGEAIADPMTNGLFARLAAAEALTLTPAAIAIFRVSLERILTAELVDFDGSPRPTKFHGCGFGTDYGPDHLLGQALDCAGLNERSMTLLPNKTVMWFGPGEVRVSHGYGAAIEGVSLVSFSTHPAPIKNELTKND